ncbi:MAG: hypothetical protein NVS9B7_11310 [Flavisolibacter sp.]
MSCILCKENNLKLVASIDSNDLCSLYYKRTGVSVKHYFEVPQINLYCCNNCCLLFYHPIISGDAAFYDQLQKYRDYYIEEKTEFNIAASYISGNQDVLEIGCGSGAFVKYITPRSYVGLEFSSKAIEKAKAKGIKVFSQSIGEHAMQNENKYDIVCFFQVLEHVDGPLEFLQNSIKVLKKGGKLIIAVPSENSFIKNVQNFYLNMPPHHVSRWKDKTFEKISELLNLKLVNIIHEPLHSKHKLFYVKTSLMIKLKALFNIHFKPVDNGLFCNFLESCATIAAFVITPFFNFSKKMGQSVLVVYEK